MGIEALNMVSALQTVEQSVAWAEGWLLEDHGLKIYTGMPLGIVFKELMAEWHKVTKSQCPFLKADKSCQIHKERPLTCRTFGIYRDCVEMNCPRPVGKGETLTQRGIIAATPELKTLIRDFKRDCERKNPGWVVKGFASTLLFRAAKPDKFQEYVANNKIASAKLIGINMDVDLLWQNQLDALRQGVNPMEVIQREMVGSAK
jgi:Fe-S-cluster containining protein